MQKKKKRIIKNENHFKKLPSDMICFEILPYLRPISIKNFGMVNKECYEYSNSNGMWKIVLYSNFYKKILEKLKVFYHDLADSKTLDYKEIYKRLTQHIKYFKKEDNRGIFKLALKDFQRLYEYFIIKKKFNFNDIIIKQDFSKKIETLCLLSKKEKNQPGSSCIFVTSNFNSNKSSPCLFYHENDEYPTPSNKQCYERLEGNLHGKYLQGLCKFTFENGFYTKINLDNKLNIHSTSSSFKKRYKRTNDLKINFNGNLSVYNKKNFKIFDGSYKYGKFLKGECFNEIDKEKDIIMKDEELQKSINENLIILDKELENEFIRCKKKIINDKINEDYKKENKFKKQKKLEKMIKLNMYGIYGCDLDGKYKEDNDYINQLEKMKEITKKEYKDIVSEDFVIFKKKIKKLLEKKCKRKKNCFSIKRLLSVLNFIKFTYFPDYIFRNATYFNEEELSQFTSPDYIFRDATYFNEEELSQYIDEINDYKVKILKLFIETQINKIIQNISDFLFNISELKGIY